MTGLSIPLLPDGCTVPQAALLYAEAGWYVLPVDPTGKGKHPGSLVGNGWQYQSTRDTGQIGRWWQRWPSAALALHTGRSGAVVLDVDHPANIPPIMRKHLGELAFQSTRLNPAAVRDPTVTDDRGYAWANQPERGHFVARCRPMQYGCSLGDLRTDDSWGEVKSGNSVIIAEPSPHPKAAEGGRYRWLRGLGELVPLPDELAACLRPPGASAGGGDSKTTLGFLAGCPERPDARCPLLGDLLAPLPGPGDRYETVRHRTMRLARLGDQGHYGVPAVLDELQGMYEAALAGEGRNAEREYTALLDGAVAEVLADPTPEADKRCCDSLNQPAWSAMGMRTAALPDPVPAAPDGNGQHAPAAIEAPRPRFTRPAIVFVKDEGFQALTAALWVEQQGPLRYGADDQVWAHLGGVWVPGEDEVHQRIAYLLGQKYQRGHEMNIRELLRAAVGRITCDPVPDVINFRNGLLYWRESDQVRPFNPDVLSTAQLPVNWNPGAQCPRFAKFLTEVLAHDDVMRAMELTGYLIRPGNPLHRLFLLYGSGRNGKGVFLRALTAMLGESNVSAVALHDLAADRFMPAELFGKTANLAGDIDATYIERTGQLKALSGDDAITGQRKFRNPFRFTPWAVSVFSANKIPTSSDSSYGWLARWEVLPFPNVFDGTDGGALEAELRSPASLEGIAAYAVRALRLLDKAGTFTRTAESDAAKTVFAKGQDPLSYWLEERAARRPGAWARRTDAYASYRWWAKESEMKPLSKRSFYDAMRQLFTEGIRDGYPGYDGIALLGAGYAH